MENNLKVLINSLSPLKGKTSIGIVCPDLDQSSLLFNVSINIGNAFSKHLQSDVLAVDCNFASPLENNVKNQQNIYLQDLLQRDENIIEGTPFTKIDNCKCILSKCGQANSISLLQSKKMIQLVNTIKNEFDYSFFMLPSMSVYPVVETIVTMFDTIIMIVNCEKTRWEVARDLKEKIMATGIDLSGVIMNQRKIYVPNWIYSNV